MKMRVIIVDFTVRLKADITAVQEVPLWGETWKKIDAPNKHHNGGASKQNQRETLE